MVITRGEKAFNRFNIVLMILISCSMLFPFVNVIAKSLSSNAMVMSGQVWLWPKEINLHAYNYIFGDPMLLTALKNTVFITVAGTFLTLLAVVTTGYSLSKKNLLYRKSIMLFFLFTMFFHAGLIPSFLNIRNLGLYDTLWALIIPGAMNIYYMILVKSFFEQLPAEMEESANIDGCNDIQSLMYIILPVSKPILATLGLFAAVHYWNIFIPGVMFIKTPDHFPLQVIVQLIVFAQMGMSPEEMMKQMSEMDQSGALGVETIKTAVIIFSSLPILCVYPFLQKYFVKGITLGAVKT